MPARSEVALRDLVEALPEPSLILEGATRIAAANRAAASRLGPLLGRELPELAAGPEEADALRAWLGRCAGARVPVPGAATLRGADSLVQRFRLSGGLLAPARAGAPALLLLRMTDGSDDRFAALGAKVRELNEEIRARRRAQALAEEALHAREVMLRELHHRVKNSVHMLAGMVASARREAAAPEARAVLDMVGHRLTAIGTVHQMLYGAESLEGLHADRFVASLALAIMRACGAAEARLSTEGDAAAVVPNDAAVPLALVLNELMTNALKYGPPEGSVRVGLRHDGTAFELSVEDDGSGFVPAESAKRASGLGLVRGLARQLGGGFSVEHAQGGGARCVLRFAARRGAAAPRGGAP